jgi:RNA polymerase sigma factor (sigma-70 family)
LSTPEHPSDIDPIIAGLVREKARRLTGRSRLSAHDREDLIQDCYAELQRKLPAFDPAKASLQAFVVRVLRRFLSNRIRHRFAAKRDPRRVSHRDAPAGAAGTTGLDALASCDGEDADLRLDVEAILQRLPPALRDLAEALKSLSVAAIAREAGLPRTTVQSRLRALRVHFERHHFAGFLRTASSLRKRTG